MRMSVEEQVRESLEKLAALGDTAHMAAYCGDEKIYGTPLLGNRCIVANYIKRTIDCRCVVVDSSHTQAVCAGEVLHFANPPAVSAFVGAFDEGQCPELQETLLRFVLYRKLPRLQGLLDLRTLYEDWGKYPPDWLGSVFVVARLFRAEWRSPAAGALRIFDVSSHSGRTSAGQMRCICYDH
jgi:hypothetical protein